MGSVKKAFKPITRVVDNIIPNEIKPALPFIAASFGAPYLAGKGILSVFGSKALGKGISASLINAATNAALGRKFNPVSSAVSGLMVGGGDFLSNLDSKFAKEVGGFLAPGKVGDMSIGEAFKAASAPATAGTIEAVADSAREAEEAYEQYLAEQEAAGNEDFQTRKEFISLYLENAGFDQETINKRLNQLGYAANGGLMGTRVGFRNGGTDYSPTVPFGGRTGEFFLNAMKEAKNEKDARPGYGEEERFRTVGEIIDPNSFLKYLFPFDEFPKIRKEIKRELEDLMEDSEKKDDNEMIARDDRIGLLFNLIQAQQALGDEADLDKIREYEAELAD